MSVGVIYVIFYHSQFIYSKLYRLCEITVLSIILFLIQTQEFALRKKIIKRKTKTKGTDNK